MANLATFKDVQDRVITYGYSEQHRAQIKAWINDAYRDLCRQRAWSWLIFTDNVTTVAGTRTVALPAPSGRRLETILEIKPADAAVEASTLTYEDIDADDPYGFGRTNLPRRTERGIPRRFMIDGANVVLDPIPDRAITYAVRHHDVPTTELSADADVTLSPADANQVLVYAVLERAALHDRNPAMAREWGAQMRDALLKLEAAEASGVVQVTRRSRLSPVYGRRFG